jgi:hypothetical protein
MAGENATEAETADHGIRETLAAIQDQCDLLTIARPESSGPART